MTRERVLSVVEAARRIIGEARDRIRGLSPEGVDLVLREHFETDPRESEITALLAATGRAPRCHVILAANVCTAPLRAIACALATAPAIFVKPSRRDAVVAELLLRELGIEPVDEVHPEPGDELHIYGSDETIAAVKAVTADGVRILAHGTGFGVAFVQRIDEAAAIAADLVPFDGRGCLSPRVAVAADPDAFAQALHEELLGAIPRGELTRDERAELTRYRQTMQAVGTWYEGPHHAVAVDTAPQAIMLPPPHRAIVVVPTAAHIAIDKVVVIGSNSGRPLPSCRHARRSVLGRMQKPPFDGPVDLRPARNAPET